MKSYKYHGVWASSVVCVSLLAAVSCGSDDGKKVNRGEDAGGQGGAGAPSSQAGGPTDLGGAGGASTPEGGAGNAGGDPGLGGGGAGGEPTAEAGAGGQPFVSSCVPSGETKNVSVITEPIYSVCRGARLAVELTADDTDESFTCCGVSNVEPVWGADFFGRSYVEVSRSFLFEISPDAPLGAQSMSIECASGPVGGAIQLNVVEGAPPVVTSVTPKLNQGEPLFVEGSNLGGTLDVRAIALNGEEYPCAVEAEGHGDDGFSCLFDVIPAVNGYRLRVNRSGCGLATSELPFDVIPPPDPPRSSVQSVRGSVSCAPIEREQVSRMFRAFRCR